MIQLIRKFTVAILLLSVASTTHAQGFLELPFRIYGKVLQADAGAAHQLHSGTLEMTFVNSADATDTSTHSVSLGKIGSNGVFSYVIDIPQQYLPDRQDVLAVGASTTSYRLQSITIDGVPATLVDSDADNMIRTRFDLRAAETRLDLRIGTPSVDRDGDGMPDWWEELHGLNPLLADDAGSDTDGDGLTNSDEFRRGTDPQQSNANAQLRTNSITTYSNKPFGLWLDAIDSDIPDSASFIFSLDYIQGVEIAKNGVAMTESETFTLADVENGRITVSLTVSLIDGLAGLFLLSGNDGLTEQINVSSFAPTADDGTEASLWLDPSSMNPESVGEGVVFWADSSGSNNSATQTEPTARPLHDPAGVDFSTGNVSLSIPETAVPVGAHTVFAAYEGSAQASQQTLFATNEARLDIEPNDGPVAYPSNERYQYGDYQISGAGALSSGAHVSMTIADEAKGSSSHNRRPGGFADSANSGTPLVQASIGANVSSFGAITSPFSGTLRELLIFPGSLSVERAIRVSDYLQSRWQDRVVWNYRDVTYPISLTMSNGASNVIRGGWGDDTLQGGSGPDLIAGGWGHDTLGGGGGPDRFSYGPNDGGNDQILDFDPSADVIDLSALFPAKSTDVDSHIQFSSDGSATTIAVDVDGDGGDPDFQISLLGVSANNSVRNSWIADGIVQAGGLRPAQSVGVSVAQDNLLESDETVEFIVERTGDLDLALDVPIALGGDAIEGYHYTIPLGGTVTGTFSRPIVSFGSGESAKTIPLSLVPNLITESDREIQLEILPQHTYETAQDAATAAVTIGDGPQQISVVTTIAEATEGEGIHAEFRLTRAGPTDTAITVLFDLYGSAQNGVDYPFVPGSIVIPVGSNTVFVRVTPYADQLIEPSETVELFLRDAASYTAGASTSASLQLHDLTPRVSIQAVAPVAQRTGNIPGYFLVTRTGNLDQDLLVNLDITGTAVNGTDYTHVFDFVEFQPGTSNVLVPVTPIGAATGAGNATVSLTIAQDPAYLRASPLADLVTIVDDATSIEVVTIVADLGYPSEEGPTAGSFKLKRSGAASSLISVDVTISGAAQNGTDYVNIPSTWTIAAGQSEVSIPIIPIADGVTEQLEDVTITVEPGTYLVGGANAATTFIEDRFTSVTISAEEPVASVAGPTSGRFVLRRNKDIASTLSVTLDVSGTADAADYAPISNTVTFAAGSSEAIVQITPIDTGETSDVTVTLAIAASNGLPATAPSSATVTIERSTQSAARSTVERISVTPLQSSVDPGTEEARFLLERTGDAIRELSVRLTVAGTLQNGADYTYISPIAIFPAGEPSIEVVLAPISWDEGDVTVSVDTVSPARSTVSAGRSTDLTTKTAAATPAAATISITRDGQAVFNMHKGWNLISLPFDAAETPLDDLFGAGTRDAFENIGRRYVRTTILKPMSGYWVHSQTAVEIPIDGRYLVTGSRTVQRGWNLVGPLLNQLTIDELSTIWAWDPERQQYRRGDRSQMKTAHGYLVFVSDPGELNLGR